MTTDSSKSTTPAGAIRIAVIGAGNIGRTLGTKWATAGHHILYGVRAPSAPETVSIADAVASAEVVLLAVPGAAAKDVLATLGEALTGKVVIDATNDIQGTGKLHALEELTDGAHPVRAFNTLGWENYADPVFDGVTADLFYAAEQGHAKQVAERLIADVGLRPVWLGGLDTFDLVDSLTQLWFTLALHRQRGRRLAFKMLVGQ
jgi:predicted dinucleotide-binding enzyme